MNSSRRQLAVLVALAAALPALAGAQEQPLTFDAIFGQPPLGQRAEQVSWRPDGKLLSYLWDAGDGRKLWGLDPTTGAAAVLVDLAALPPAREGDKGFAPASVAWSPSGEALLFSAADDLWLYELTGSGGLRRLTSSPAEEGQAAFSPDGRRVAFVRDFDLFVLDLASGREEALTHDGRANAILNGTTDWVYWEEIWDRRQTGFWWSPDGRALAFYRFDDTGVGEFPLVDYRPVYPKLDLQKYPKAGQANPKVRVGVLDLARKTTTWLATGGADDDYLVRVDWLPDSRRVAVQRLNRDQNRLELLACELATGTCSTLLVESWPTWINLSHDLRFLADGGFLWSSERSGWRRLYRYAADGSGGQAVSPEGWAIDSLAALREDRGFALCSGYRTGGLGAAERHALSIRLDGSRSEVLTVGRGWHSINASPRTDFWVDSWSDADTPSRSRLVALDGRQIAELPVKPVTAWDPAALPRWELLTVPGPNGSRLPARLLRPASLEPGRRYPVLMYHYGGPGSQVVVDRWGGTTDLWHRMLVQRGILVFSVDNQASAFFGKQGEDLVHRRFGEVELAGQLAGVDYLASLPFVDATRLGLWGWSGGGSNTLYSVFNRPGVWRAAVAGAPVTDWRLYDTVWTERYLDHPEANAEGYRLSSPLTHGEKLADALLVLHGLADDNVHPQNTINLVERLVAAKRPFEWGLYPGQKHGFRGPASRYSYERMTEFFERYLGAR